MTYIHYKRTELTKHLGLLLIGTAIVFIIVDWGYGLLSFSYPYYLVLCAFGGLSYYLCTINQQILAATTGQLVTYLVIFAFATDKNIMDGTLLFYIPAVLAIFVLFDSKQFVLRIVFCGLAIILFFTARYVDWDVFSYGPESALTYPASFIIYFFSALLLSILLLQFLVKINTKVENGLLEKQNELRQLSLRLKKNQTRLALANKGSKIGVYEWNLTTNKVYVSDDWLVLLGYVNHVSISDSSDSFLARIHVEDRQTMIAAIKRYQHLPEPYEVEIRRKTSSGGFIWCLDRGMVTTQHDGSHLIVGTTMNIHERKKNELVIQEQMKKLQFANRELDAFVYTASHDLRSPLNSILQLMSTASSSKSLDDVKTYLAYMKNSIKVLNEFILSLAEYAQGTNKELAIERIEIWYLIKEILDSLRYNSWYQNVETTIDIPYDIVIYTDKSRLRIVLNNLIINAIKYQDQQKETQFVKIVAEQRGDDIHLLIIDNGIGIENDYLEQIFDMFYRAQNSIEGSGLGLYITSEIIAQMKGRLFFCSLLEEGSAVKMILPGVLSTSSAAVEPALEIVG